MTNFSYAKALDTVAWFLGKDGWPIVQPMLERRLKDRGILWFGFHMHDGSYYQIRFEGCFSQDMRV